MIGRVRDEAELIATYLAPLAGAGGLGLADDAAVIAADGVHDLVVTTDPIICDVHFFADDAPGDIAWKALAVNVSDLVAKGAEPFAYTLALALPDAPTHAWMAGFAAGLEEAQAAFGCRLIGGDTDRTPGPLSIAVTAFGKVPSGQMVQRQTARPGDHVFVSGTVGDAALGLLVRREAGIFGDVLPAGVGHELVGRYLRPVPRPGIIPALRAFASAALDVSDGLVQDAGKLAKGAGAALAIRFDAIPLSQGGRSVAAVKPQYRGTILAGGDDYEVLFSVPAARLAEFGAFAAKLPVPVTEIGVLAPGSGVLILDADGAVMPLRRGGYDHFSGTGSL